MKKKETIEESVDKIAFTSIGIRKISLFDLKKFKRFCSRESDNDYGRGISLLVDFFEQGMTNWLIDHERRIQSLEGSKEEKEPESKEDKKKAPLGFGARKEEIK